MSERHKHRKTKAKKEPVPIHSTVLSDSSVSSMDMMSMWQRRMNLMNQVTMYRDRKDHDLAEPLQKEIVSIDEKLQGPNSSSSGLSWNKLGEIQFEMGKITEAEPSLKRAVEVREGLGEDFDTAVSRDNLARVYEAQGRMYEAREMRLRGRPSQNISCGSFKCTIPQGVGFDKLKACSQCKVVFYCSVECQRVDWKERHKNTCKPTTTVPDPTMIPA